MEKMIMIKFCPSKVAGCVQTTENISTEINLKNEQQNSAAKIRY